MQRDHQRQLQLRPPNLEWDKLSDADLKGYAQDFIGRALAMFEHENESPDEWEASDLLYACGLIAAGMYTAAVHYTDRALTPLDKRSERQPKAAFVPSLSELQHAHHEVSHLEVLSR